jgi:RNA polymerase sigma-70 factor (ECF subfamily)
LRVAQYQHTFTGGEFRAWIFTVTRHTCLSTKKKGIQHRISTERVGDGENLDNDVASEVRNALSMVNDPLENLSMSEQTALLLKAIAELPETYREALILSDYEGLTYEEIGRITGTSLSTIRIRVFRAKARLRKVLLPIIGDSV